MAPHPMRLYLVRHGETAWSLSGQHTGVTDIPLTPHGETQARALASWLADIAFAHVFTSPRQRAHQTCVLAGLATATVEPDLAEWDYGDYEGETSRVIRAARPGWDVFRDGCPGGEMPTQIAARADRLLASLTRLSGNIALFTHGEFGAALAARWIGLDVPEGQRFVLGTASVSILGWRPGHEDVPAILMWNGGPESKAGWGVPPAPSQI